MAKLKKLHMDPRNGEMFDKCIHTVTLRPGVGKELFDWLQQQIEPTDTGFWPWTRVGNQIKFLREQDAVMCALKWA